MSIRNKIYLSLLIPVLALLFYSVSEIALKYKIVSNLVIVTNLVETSSHMSKLVHELQKERGMTAGFIGSNGSSFANEIKGQRKITDEKFEILESYVNSISDDLPAKFLNETKHSMEGISRISQLRSSVDSLSIPLSEALGFYTKVNAGLLGVVNHAANYSTDVEVLRDITSYGNFLMSKERAGIERAVLTNTFAQDKFGAGFFKKFIVLVAEQDSYMEAFEHTSNAEMKQMRDAALSDPSFREVEKYRSIASAKAYEGNFGVDANVWFSTISKKINVLKKTDDLMSVYIGKIAKEHHSSARAAMILNIIVGVVSLVAVVVMVLIMQVSVLGNIGKLIKLTGELNSGDADLTKRINVHTKDEIHQLAENVNTFIGSIQVIVDDVKQTSNSLATSSSEFAATAEELSNTFDNQTSQVNDMASAMEEMNVTSGTINENIEEVNVVTMDAFDSTQKGSRQLKEVVDKINSIKTSTNELSETIASLNMSSNEIGNIVGAISDIADQTNLLALNAAIEAARAGDAGRGFAVVADEVRKLAEKTQDATKQIVDIINVLLSDAKSAGISMDHAKLNVDEGVNVVEETNAIFASIEEAVSKVKSVNDIFSISIAEQADAINISTENTTQFSMGIQDSATAVRQIHTTVEDLEKQALNLNSTMSRFKT